METNTSLETLIAINEKLKRTGDIPDTTFWDTEEKCWTSIYATWHWCPGEDCDQPRSHLNKRKGKCCCADPDWGGGFYVVEESKFFPDEYTP